MPVTHPGLYRPSRVSPSGRGTLFPNDSKVSDANKKVAAFKQKHKGAQKSKGKDSTINDDAAIEAAIQQNNNFVVSPIKRTTNDDEKRAKKRTRKSLNVTSKKDSNMDANYCTNNPIGHPEDQIKHGEQDLFARSDDEIKEEGGIYCGFPISSILEDESEGKNKELDVSTTYSANSPAYSLTSLAYSPTSPVQLPESPAPAKPDDKWSNSSSVPPEYYVNDYSKLVNANQPGLTSMSMLIHIIANKKHQQGMSRHFATIGTPSRRQIDFAINIIVGGGCALTS